MRNLFGGGRKIYLASDIIKLVRPPPNAIPTDAYFRIPPHMNKLDLRNYLYRIYNLKALDIRTYNPPVKSYVDVYGKRQNLPIYKKAVITMQEGFRWPSKPDIMEDFGGKERMEAIKKRMRYTKGDWQKNAEKKPEPKEGVYAEKPQE